MRAKPSFTLVAQTKLGGRNQQGTLGRRANQHTVTQMRVVAEVASLGGERRIREGRMNEVRREGEGAEQKFREQMRE